MTCFSVINVSKAPHTCSSLSVCCLFFSLDLGFCLFLLSLLFQSCCPFSSYDCFGDSVLVNVSIKRKRDINCRLLSNCFDSLLRVVAI
uniref:Putative ovule protein n=1 Tax=Solanum chacoense TaxID=4108 RepID=A0A0V0IF64_SOLCH